MNAQRKKKIVKVIKLQGPPDFWKRFDQWREKNDFPSRAEAIKTAMRLASGCGSVEK